MIPKIIHYCWISDDPFPQLVERCIESWKMQMPEYELKLWNKDKCMALNIDFIKDAIDFKKYAFAADVVRVMALYLEGGIYLDSDVFLKKSLEPLLNNSFVSFLEVYPNMVRKKITYKKYDSIIKVKGISIQAAVMASEKGHPYLSQLVDYYSDKRFNKKSMKYFMRVIAPDIQASKLIDFGFQYKDELQILNEGITIYPSTLLDSNRTFNYPESYGVHYCLGSWVPPLKLTDRVIYLIKRAGYMALKFLKII